MPNTTAAIGAKDSTSIAIIQHSAIQSFDTLGRQVSKLAYRTRRSQVRHLSTTSYAIFRRREQPIKHAAAYI